MTLLPLILKILTYSTFPNMSKRMYVLMRVNAFLDGLYWQKISLS